MLQLPQGKPARFTRAQIADMTRGTSKAKGRQPRVDPIFKALRDVEKYRLLYVSAFAAHDGLKKLHGPKLFEPAKVWLSGGDMLVLGSISERGWSHPKAIDSWAKKYTADFRAKVSSQNGSWGQGTRCIKLIRELKPRLKAALEKRRVERDRLRRRLGITRAFRLLRKVEDKWLDAETAAVNTVPTTLAGVDALLEYVRFGCEQHDVEGSDDTTHMCHSYTADALKSVKIALANLADAGPRQ